MTLFGQETKVSFVASILTQCSIVSRAIFSLSKALELEFQTRAPLLEETSRPD